MQRPLFRILGVPVTVDPMFLLGALLFYQWAGGGRYGLVTVVALFVFLILHELGHALTAKAYGADATITLTLIAGYANISSATPLPTWKSNVISVAGPATEFVAAIPAIALAQHLARNGGSADTQQLGLELYVAVRWVGPLLALVNLLPLWPLDGGHVASTGARRLGGPNGERTFLLCSIAAASVLVVASFAVPAEWTDRGIDLGAFESNPFAALPGIVADFPRFVLGAWFIPLFVIFGSVQQLRAHDAAAATIAGDVPSGRELRHADAVRAARAAERAGWESGSPGEFPRGWSPSPWLRAHLAMLERRPDAAADALAGLADEHFRDWLVDRADRPQIALLLDMVPPAVASSLEARVHHGSAEDLVAQATERFHHERSAEPLYLGAAGLAVRGMADEAMAWLSRAVDVAPDPHRIATAPEFRTLHGRSDFQQLLGRAERAARPVTS